MANIYDIIEKNKDKLTNENLCSACRGACCRLTPCNYFVKDLELSKENILKYLNDGKTSIKVKIMRFSDKNKIITVPVPIITVRGRRRDAIDLFSPSTKCIAIKADGCSLDVKPTGAKILVPGPDGYLGGENGCYNLLQEHPHSVLAEWMDYHSILVDAVEEFSQESFENLYYRDLIVTTGLLLTNELNEYNYNLLNGIIKSMQLPNVFMTSVNNPDENIGINEVMRPDRGHINYLRPSEHIYRKAKLYYEKKS